MKIFRINSNSEQESQDRKLREKMAEHSVTPPAFVWDKIDSEMQKPARNRRRFILFLAALAACVAGITFGVLTFLHTNSGNLNKNIASGSEISQSGQKEIVNINNDNKNLSEDKELKNIKDQSKINNELSDKETSTYSSLAIADGGGKSTKTNAKISVISKDKNKDFPAKNNSIKQQQKNAVSLHPDKVLKTSVKPDNLQKNNTELQTENNKTAQSSIFSEKENNIVPEAKENAIAIDKTHEKTDNLIAKTKVDSSANVLNKTPENILSENAAGKKEHKSLAAKTKWSFGLHAAAGISYRAIGENNKRSVNQDVMSMQSASSRNTVDPNLNSFTTVFENEKPAFSFSTGISAGFEISKKISLQSGFYYLKSGYFSTLYLHVPYDANTTVYDPNSSPPPTGNGAVGTTTTGNNNPDSLVASTYNYTNERSSAGRYSFPTTEELISSYIPPNSVYRRVKIHNYFEWIRTPLQLRYTSGSEKIKWFVQSGISANFLMNKYAVIVEDPLKMQENRKGEIDGYYNSIALGAGLSAGVAFSIDKNISLEFRPEFEYMFTPIFNQDSHSLHPYFFQVNTGLVKYF